MGLLKNWANSILVLAITALVALSTMGVGDADAGGRQREPVTACPEAGPGFIRYPDTDTCFIIRADLAVIYQHEFIDEDLFIAPTRSIATFWDPTVVYFLQPIPPSSPKSLNYVDARISVTIYQRTDNGPLLAHIGFRDIPTFLLPNPGNPFAPAIFVPPVNTGPAALLEQAWIKWNGFTFGKHASMFNFVPGFNYVEGYTSVTDLVLFAYATDLSDTISAVISLEDNASRRYQDGVWAFYGRNEIPDIVAAIRSVHDWGAIHIAGALHHIRDTNICCFPVNTIANGDTFAWAVTAAVEYRTRYDNGMAGRVLVTGAYTEGALSYLGMPFFATDYITEANGSLAVTRGYSAVISYEHVWAEDWKSAFTVSIYGTETDADQGFLVAPFNWNTRGVFAQAGIEHMLVPGLAIGAELDYFRDSVQAINLGVPGAWNTAEFFRTLVYVRRQI